MIIHGYGYIYILSKHLWPFKTTPLRLTLFLFFILKRNRKRENRRCKGIIYPILLESLRTPTILSSIIWPSYIFRKALFYLTGVISSFLYVISDTLIVLLYSLLIPDIIAFKHFYYLLISAYFSFHIKDSNIMVETTLINTILHAITNTMMYLFCESLSPPSPISTVSFKTPHFLSSNKKGRYK